mgnify:CR=1 FL=1
MCTNYSPTSRDRLRAARLGVAHLPPRDWPPEAFPGYEAPIVVRSESEDASADADGDAALAAADATRCLLARFGLVPRWSRDAAHARELSRHTVNARNETTSVKPSYRTPWRERRWALVPMDDFFEPCWETGHAVRWRLASADGSVLTAAALWEGWTDPASGEIVNSFSLLTVNADGHPLMGRMHRPGEEKRMPVLIAPADRNAWLNASDADARLLMRAMPAGQLVAAPAPRAASPRAARKPAAAAAEPGAAPAPHEPPAPPAPGTNLDLF